MKIVRYQHGLEAFWGVLGCETVHALEGGLEAPRKGEALHGLADVTLLAPCTPGKVVSLGANYAARCRENELPVPQAPAAHDSFRLPGDGPVIGPEAPLRLPPWERHAEYGAELGIVIGRACHNIQPADAHRHILGYTCLNNVWAKTRPSVPGAVNIRVYDSFCPVGPWIETELNTRDLAIRLEVDGEVRQTDRTSSMLFDVPTIVAFLARHLPLEAGDLLMTGTTAGVRPIVPGSRIEIEIEGIGRLATPVVADPSPRRRPLERLSS